MGAGELYLMEMTGEAIPEDATIETEANNVGETSGGAAFEYKPEKYDIINSYGATVKSFITKEECTFKTGILTWDLEKIKLLTTAVLTKDSSKNINKLTFTGSGALKNVLVRFVHTKDDGKKIRLTMVANAGNGFNMEFSGEKETIIDAELTAIQYVKNFIAEISEEVTPALA